MRVLITRPRHEAVELARKLEALGHEAIVEPMLEIEPMPAALELDGVQAIVLTSANAAPALGSVPVGLPVYAVGAKTAAVARAAGADPVHAADGDARRLADLLAARCRPEAGALLHLAGADVRPGLAEALAAAGLDLRRQVVYRARPAAALSPSLRDALQLGTIDAVLLFSPRTAAIFADRVRRYDLARGLAGTEAVCLSAAVAAACRALPWRTVRVAARPDEAALLDLLDGPGGTW